MSGYQKKGGVVDEAGPLLIHLQCGCKWQKLKKRRNSLDLLISSLGNSYIRIFKVMALKIFK